MKRSAIGAALLAAGILVGGALLPARGDRGTRNEQRGDLSGAFSPSSTRSIEATVSRLENRAADPAAAPKVFSDLGLAYLQQGRATADPAYLTKALNAFAEALASAPSDFRALVGSAVLAGSQHRFFDMEELARRAIVANPYSGPAYGVLGDAFLETQRYARAERAYQAMLDRRPDFAAFARISYFHETLADFRQAARWMRRVLDAATSAEDFAYASYHLFQLSLRRHDLVSARRHLERATELAPDSHLTLAGRAHLAYIDGDIEEAKALFERALGLYPSINYMASLAELSLSSGDEEAARDFYERASAREEEFLANGALPDAELAVFATDSGRLEEALEIATRLHEERRTGATEEALGWALHNAGHPKQALRLLRASIHHRGDSHTMFFAAQAATELGRLKMACRYLETALELDPYFSYRYAVEARDQLAACDAAQLS